MSEYPFAKMLDDLTAGYASLPDNRFFRPKAGEPKELTPVSAMLPNVMAPLSQDVRFMKYREFLKTGYWRDVRKAMYKRHGRRCSVCYCGGMIDVHHKSYVHHGDELQHLDDLVLLCRVCHGNEHGLAICKLCEFPKGKGAIETAGGKYLPCPSCSRGKGTTA